MPIRLRSARHPCLTALRLRGAGTPLPAQSACPRRACMSGLGLLLPGSANAPAAR
jgi:hypothetical protein